MKKLIIILALLASPAYAHTLFQASETREIAEYCANDSMRGAIAAVNASTIVARQHARLGILYYGDHYVEAVTVCAAANYALPIGIRAIQGRR